MEYFGLLVSFGTLVQWRRLGSGPRRTGRAHVPPRSPQSGDARLPGARVRLAAAPLPPLLAAPGSAACVQTGRSLYEYSLVLIPLC